jgi:hypothetical protein
MLRILRKMNFSAALELGKLPLKTTAKPGNFSGEFPSNLSWGVMTVRVSAEEHWGILAQI